MQMPYRNMQIQDTVFFERECGRDAMSTALRFIRDAEEVLADFHDEIVAGALGPAVRYVGVAAALNLRRLGQAWGHEGRDGAGRPGRIINAHAVEQLHDAVSAQAVDDLIL